MSTRQRIMMVSTHGYVAAEPPLGKLDTGGQVVYVMELAKCLARLGYNVDVLTRGFDGQPAEEPVSKRCRILRFPCGGDAFIPKETLADSIPEWVQNVRAFVAAHDLRYDWIVSHYWDAGLAGRLLADRWATPHVFVPHSLGSWKRDNMHEDAEALERKYNLRARIAEEQRILRTCAGVIATTPAQRDVLTGDEYRTPEQRIRVIPPGYDDTRFFPVSSASRDALKEEFGLSGRIVLALGRAAQNKGFDLLARAMPAVFDRVPEARLLLPIAHPEQPAVQAALIDDVRRLARELGIAERVLIRDNVSDADLPDYYRMADAFALSSRYEPFGMTAIEAMACGTPTVLTVHGGLWRQVTWGAEAVYADPFDPDAFGHAVCTLLQHPEIAAQLARHGSQKARAEFTWMGIAQQVLEALESLREPTRSPARTVSAAATVPVSSTLRAPAPQRSRSPWDELHVPVDVT